MTANYITSITQEQLFAVLQPWLVTCTGLPSNCVIQGIPNRGVMPPPTPGFVAMTMVRRERIITNIDTWESVDADPTQITQEAHFKVTIQLDFYSGSTAGNSVGTAFDWCSIVETLWRDNATCVALAPVASPLYTNPPIMAPLDDVEDQYEQRWMLEAVLQYNPLVSVPAQFADTLGPVAITDALPGGGFAPPVS